MCNAQVKHSSCWLEIQALVSDRMILVRTKTLSGLLGRQMTWIIFHVNVSLFFVRFNVNVTEDR